MCQTAEFRGFYAELWPIIDLFDILTIDAIFSIRFMSLRCEKGLEFDESRNSTNVAAAVAAILPSSSSSSRRTASRWLHPQH